MGSPEAPDEGMAVAVGNVMASDNGSEVSDAYPLSIGNHATAALGLRQTDLLTLPQRHARAKPGASAAGEVLPLKSEGAVPSPSPSPWALLHLPSCSSAVGYCRVVYDAEGAL